MSFTIVSTEEGKLLAAGYAVYPSPLSIAQATSHVSKEIAKIIKQ
jgi:hypothetical protein